MFLIPNIDNPFWPGVARGLQDTLADAGFSVVFANSDWDANQESLFLELARRNRFDAIAINPANVAPQELASLGVPIVILGLRRDYARVRYGRLRQPPGYASGARLPLWVRASAYRVVVGTQQPVTLACLRGISRHPQFGFGRSVGGGRRRTAWKVVVVQPGLCCYLPDRPTAIFASNDVLALAAIQVAFEMKLSVPARSLHRGHG